MITNKHHFIHHFKILQTQIILAKLDRLKIIQGIFIISTNMRIVKIIKDIKILK